MTVPMMRMMLMLMMMATMMTMTMTMTMMMMMMMMTDLLSLGPRSDLTVFGAVIVVCCERRQPIQKRCQPIGG